MNILIVEHSKVFRTLWERMILREGHEPILAEDAGTARELLSSSRIDLVCTSLSLPDEDGIKLCKSLREQPAYQHLPFLLLTTTHDQSVRSRAFESGVTDILDKTNVAAFSQRICRLAVEYAKNLSGKILYVEDSLVAAHKMMKILEGMDMEIDHFTSADTAFEQFSKDDYDLIISDIVVEGSMSGVDLVHRVRAMDDDKSRIPILALTGLDDVSRRIELFKLGVNDFVTKPAITEEVKARVTNLITNKKLFDQVRAQQKHLYQLAMTDHLTGLYNRASLNEFGPKYCSEASRHDLSLSLIMIDLDHFKDINDKQGHLAGDTVLAAVGELLKQFTRKEDFAARYGGEEFVLIFNHCDSNNAMQRATELKERLAELKPEGIAFTASLGVTTLLPGQPGNLESLFHFADQAVYAAKQAGRNRVSFKKYAY